MNGICPICQNPKGLINGIDSKQYIEYPPDKLEQFEAGELTLTQLNEFAEIYYNRTRLCDNAGNSNYTIKDSAIYKYSGMSPEEGLALAHASGDTYLLNPPCINYYGRMGGTLENPNYVVETLKIKDE